MPFPENIWSFAVCAGLNRVGLQNCLESQKSYVLHIAVLFTLCFKCTLWNKVSFLPIQDFEQQKPKIISFVTNLLLSYPTTKLYLSNFLDS